MIVAQNALLNQYVPTFFIKDIAQGQTLVYDSVRKAFVNSSVGGGTGGANKLGELLNVSPTVDSPNPTLANGQALVYNSLTSLWENKFIDYNTLLNTPTSSNYSFAGLSDTAKPSLPGGYVQWNSTGTQLIYSTTIPAASITGLATVAYTGNYNDLLNKPITLGTVTTVSVVSANGVSGTVANPTTTPAITLTLGNITPNTVTASGLVSGSNLTGTNTGDQTIRLTGDVIGTGTGTFATSLATVNNNVGTYGSQFLVPQITVDGKGRVTNVTNIPISSGTVTSVSASGFNGVSAIVTNSTTTPNIAINLGNITPTSVTTTGALFGSNFTGSSSGINTGDQTITLTGDVTGSGKGNFPATLAIVNSSPQSDAFRKVTVTAKGLVTATSAVTATDLNSIYGYVPYSSANPMGFTSNTGSVTSVAASGSADISVTGSPITTTGTLSFSLLNTTVTAGTYGSTTSVPQFTVDAKGRVTGVTNVPISGAAGGTVTSVSGAGTVSGLTLTGTVTTSGSLTLGGALTLTSGQVTTALGFTPYNSANPAGYTNNTGTVTSVTVSGTTGRIISTGSPITSAGSITLDLAASGATAGTYGSTTSVPQIVVDTYGRITSVNNVSIPLSSGTVTSVNASGSQGITVTGGPVTSSGTIAIGLGNITPTSVAATGTVSGSNLSGSNTGDQTVTVSGDATGVSTGAGSATSLPITLATVNTSPGTYGNSSNISVVTVNNKGLVTSVVTTPVDITVSDLLPADGSTTETFTIANRHQYIVTGRLEIVGHVINNGRIAVL